MRPHRLLPIFKDERGVALPMALIIILILSALMAAFSVLGTSEPVLAGNQQRVAQARAIAESGLERVIWALNNPDDANGIPNPMVTAPAPYDGSVYTAVSLGGVQVGGFRVTVTRTPDPAHEGQFLDSQRNVVVDGWVPSETATLRVKQRIQVTVFQIRSLGGLPSALTVRGEIGAGGHSLIDASSDTSCGDKTGSTSEGATTVSGSAEILGHDGNSTANQTTDISQNQPDSVFAQYAYSSDELDALKVLARANGTYYQGTVTFNSSYQIPNGIVYVDTVSGQNIDKDGPNTTPTSDFALVYIHGNAPVDASGIFSGMLVVAGSLNISGTFQMHGLVYSINDFTYQGTGTGQIVGGVSSQNIRDTSTTSIDSNTGGNATIIWNCSYVKTGGGTLPTSFMIKAGTYKEVSG